MDTTSPLAATEYERGEETDRLVDLLGIAVGIYEAYALATTAGALFGDSVPDGFHSEFVIPLPSITETQKKIPMVNSRDLVVFVEPMVSGCSRQ